jgi:hypothetical protein
LNIKLVAVNIIETDFYPETFEETKRWRKSKHCFAILITNKFAIRGKPLNNRFFVIERGGFYRMSCANKKVNYE